MTKIPLECNDYFMSVAFLTALMSKESIKVGACIINADKKVVGLGYNRAPEKGVNISEETDTSTIKNYIKSKYSKILFAEMDAITNKTCLSLDDCTMYTLVCPWNECAKLIIASGIKKVFYYSDKFDDRQFEKVSKALFKEANVTLKKFTPGNEKSSQNFKEMAQKTVNIPNSTATEEADLINENKEN